MKLKLKMLALAILVPLFFMVALPSSASAADLLSDVCNSQTTGEKPSVCDAGDEDPLTGTGGLLLRVGSLLTIVTGMASIIMIIYGGYKYVASSGNTTPHGNNPSKVAVAKSIITYAVVGLVVSVLARAILLFVINRVKT